jgi:3'-5' exoribonuclease
MKKMFIKDLKSGDGLFGEIFAVKSYKRGTTKNNNPYIDIVLSDNSGTVKGKIWGDDFVYCEDAEEGSVVNISGTVGDYQGELQVRITNLSKIDNYEESDFQPTSQNDTNEMIEGIREFSDKVHDLELQKILKAFWEDKKVVDSYEKAPAAFSVHHAYGGGLIEHTLEMLKIADTLTGIFPSLNKDLLVTGVIFHDLGKIKEYEIGTTISITTEGKLMGHIFIGAELVKSYARKYDTEESTVNDLVHLILSHHGKMEFGSPIIPKSSEAVALYMIDDLSAKVNSVVNQTIDLKNGEFGDFARIFGTELYRTSLKTKEEGK